MRGRLTAIKNIAWALAIVLCLLAVFIGLLFAAFTRNSEEQFRGGVKLGTRPVKTENVDSAGTRPAQMSDGTLKTLPQTEDAGQAYIDSLTFLCDSPWIGLKSYGMLSGGESTTQVWTSVRQPVDRTEKLRHAERGREHHPGVDLSVRCDGSGGYRGEQDGFPE